MAGPSAHHELGASGAYRWLVCPGSVPAQRGKPESSSVFAEEGTSAHELSECTLNFWKGVEGSTRATQDWNKAAEAAGYDVREMVRETTKYVEYVKDLCEDNKDALVVEMRVGFGDVIPGGFGTSDTVVVLRNANGSARRVDIADLKYGKGKTVYADDNPQLRLYAYGTVLNLIENDILDDEFDDFSTIPVGLHICQPRLDHFDSVEMTVAELIEWAETEVAPKVIAIQDGADERVPGSHCDFCKVQATCKAKAESIAKDLETDWDDFVEDGPDMSKPGELSAEEIGKLLKLKADVEKWFKALKEHAYSEIENGGAIEGWKLIEGNNVRKWDDPDAVLEDFKNQRTLKQDDYAPRKLISVPQADKVLGPKSKIRDRIVIDKAAPKLVESKHKKPALTFEPLSSMFDADDDI